MSGPTPSQSSAWSVITRAARYVRPFAGRFVVKGAFVMVSLLPLLILPWPIKLIVDNVILEIPVEDPVRPYPGFLAPIIRMLEGRETGEILVILVAVQLLLFLLVGAFGTQAGERDTADASLAQGHDTATRTEAEANSGWSFAGGLLGLADFRYTLRLSQDMNHHYRSKLFDRVQRLPMTAVMDERIGDAVYRVMYDTPSITNATYRILLTPVAAPLNTALTAWILWLTFGPQPHLMAAVLVTIPAAFLGSLPFAGALRRSSTQSRESGSTTTSTAEEGMANILAVQSLGGESRQQARFDRDSWQSFGRYRRVVLLQVFGITAMILPVAVIYVWALLRISDDVIAGALTLGDFSLLLVYLGRLFAPSISLGMLWFSVQDSAAGLERVFFLMDLPNEADDGDGGDGTNGQREFERLREGVTLEGIDYQYPDGTIALQDVDAHFSLGRMIALVGPAGAGKTTLASLIPRFIDPTSGRVLFDGVDARAYSLASLRAHTSFVFQETMLFDGTVAENIRLARPDASDLDLRRAAELAGADEFIARLPQGYDTPLGQRGGKLSVGQKQRLSIARALVRDAPIMVLDEPTSALDPRTESQLVATLHQAREGRLVLVIAHRLSTIRASDEIFFVDEGRIIERGSHAELMQIENGRYRRFTELQGRGAA